MSTLLQLVWDLVERPAERSSYRADPHAYLRDKGRSDLTGEDVAAAVEVVRELVTAGAAEALAEPLEHAPSPAPAPGERPLDAGIRLLDHLVDAAAELPDAPPRPELAPESEPALLGGFDFGAGAGTPATTPQDEFDVDQGPADQPIDLEPEPASQPFSVDPAALFATPDPTPEPTPDDTDRPADPIPLSATPDPTPEPTPDDTDRPADPIPLSATPDSRPGDEVPRPYLSAVPEPDPAGQPSPAIDEPEPDAAASASSDEVTEPAAQQRPASSQSFGGLSGLPPLPGEADHHDAPDEPATEKAPPAGPFAKKAGGFQLPTIGVGTTDWFADADDEDVVDDD